METQDEEIIAKMRQDVIFLLNISHAMLGEPIKQINKTMQAILPMIKNVSAEKEVQLSVKVIKFSSYAELIKWNAENENEPLIWDSISASSCNEANIICAINLIKNEFQQQLFDGRSCRPVIVLISNGLHDNTNIIAENIFDQDNLSPKKIIRIAIGTDNAIQENLSRFATVGYVESEDGWSDEIAPLVFNSRNIHELKYIIHSVIGIPFFDECEYDNDYYGSNMKKDITPVFVPPCWKADWEDGDWE